MKDIAQGEIQTPPLLQQFFRVLYGGLNKESQTEKFERRVSSSCQDALFITRCGKVKPSKHIALGIAVKSLTNRRKVIDILNRFGHTINYNAIEEIENSLAHTIEKESKSCPEGTVYNRDLITGLAFDNFDVLCETLSGSDTVHDTLGILYQTIADEVSVGEPTLSRVSPDGRSSLRKRKLDVTETLLEPYRKKPRMSSFDYQVTELSTRLDRRSEISKMDYAWLMCHAFQIGTTPMWVGFNAQFIKDETKRQQVLYMKNLNKPITSLDVVNETLRITQRCAIECDKKYGIVTYDLNAAKSAMQIQVTESPKYDKSFIMLGQFHIEMAFFKALGKLIDSSGGPEILTETEVLALGSLNGFLSGRHFNRCKRLHPILPLAFEMLHFQQFLNTYNDVDLLKSEIATLLSGDEEDWLKIQSSPIFTDCITKYEECTNQTRAGVHGPTAQFWILYIDYAHDYHIWKGQFEQMMLTCSRML